MVLAVGLKSFAPLKEKMAGSNVNVIVAGDASKVKNGLYNIQEGFEAGIML